MRRQIRCPGYDANGRGFNCPNPLGGHRSPYWCAECDRRRIERISEQLDHLVARMTPDGQPAPAPSSGTGRGEDE